MTSTAAEELPTMQDVLNAIVEERGGRSCFNEAQYVAARCLTRLLSEINNGDTAKVSGITALVRLLPPKLSKSVPVEAPSLQDYLAELAQGQADGDGAAV
jgi:hypothetical protein